MIQRRKFLIGLATGIVAPAIIPYKSLMPIKGSLLPDNLLVQATERVAYGYIDSRVWIVSGYDQYGNRVSEVIQLATNEVYDNPRSAPH